jgi:hypothetical protein
MDKTDLSIPEELKEARSWMKAIPAFGVLFVITWLVLEWLLSIRPEISGMSLTARHSVAFFGALVLVGVGYSAGNFWDDRVFDPLYSVDPKRNFVGKYIPTTRRNLFGFLPAGDDLTRARARAITALLPSGSDGAGIYKAAETIILKSGKTLDGYLPFSKFFRSLIWPAVLLSGGLLVLTVYRSFTVGSFDVPSFIETIGAAVIAVALFIPYINFRVEHMIRLYEQA